MYVPSAFREDDPDTLRAIIRNARLAQFVTATATGPIATPLPMFLDPDEGEHGVLYGHLARPNPQWQEPVLGEALAIFMGADAYVSAGWYPSKQVNHKVVPTWDYEAVQAFGPVEFFSDANRLLDVVTRLTDRHEAHQKTPWHVTDAPVSFIQGQLKGIVGLRLPITRLVGKRKMSQNRSAEDRAGVARGLAESSDPLDRVVASMIPLDGE
ncbi:FMN-binding negative transcriptional regulator [Acetobacter senegalensis]|uniref:FMN-binding negative transcriptional regulator n=1 Tax=Acetobacter senegalensis TaxID=446692 RepID=UPI001EDA5A24|nr:FMN-binding negative transcriptional regulator [Acetobacter senegalensis]MCG4255392.1 FMN-binding negative transcriptional regulator [Acetobacter senegalensis]